MLKKILIPFVSCLALFAGQAFTALADESSPTQSFPMGEFSKLQNDRNYNEAIELSKSYFEQERPEKCRNIFDVLQQTINCMSRVNRIAEADDFLETVVEKFPEDSRTLQAVGRIYIQNKMTPLGNRVDDKFQRGDNRFKYGDERPKGEFMLAKERDRVRAIQLMAEAEKHLEQSDFSNEEKGRFYIDFASAIMYNRDQVKSWKLQTLTDLSKLPDYQIIEFIDNNTDFEQSHYSIPVDEEGNPFFFAKPDSFEDAKSDGERWRFLIDKAEQIKETKIEAMESRAKFAYEQYDVHTIVDEFYSVCIEHNYENGGHSFGINHNNSKLRDLDKFVSSFQLETLSDNETVAHLSTGFKRFDLPDDYNYIKIIKEINSYIVQLANNDFPFDSDNFHGLPSRHPCDFLAMIYFNRRQFSKAAEYWKELADKGDETAKRLYEQTVNPRGRIVSSQQKGMKATIGFQFRNATEVQFKINRIDVDALVQDAKAEIEKAHDPKDIQEDNFNFDKIGYRLIIENQSIYIKEEVRKWVQTLKPAENHFDKQIDFDVTFPDAGAYLIEAVVSGGNTHYAIVWINNTVLVRKEIENCYWYFVADSNTGKALPFSVVEFFGFKDSFFASTDENGQLIIPREKINQDRWLITVKGQDGKHQTWQGIPPLQNDDENGFYYRLDDNFNGAQFFSMTDRPVYRPAQKVQFKLWTRDTPYNQYGVDLANSKAGLIITNPQGEELLSKIITFDAFGGYVDEIELPADAMPGTYGIYVQNIGSQVRASVPCHFLVENCQLPGFTVEVNTPEKRVTLGEKIHATVKVKNNFGKPVSHAKAFIWVTLSGYNERCAPTMPWDWLFGRGYCWSSCDYPWSPNCNSWDYTRPVPPKHFVPPLIVFPHALPKVIFQKEVDINPDGTYDVDIYTDTDKLIYGDQNLQYDFNVRVADSSQQAIEGFGKVIASAKPYTVFVWTNRGEYKPGDVLTANFKAQTLDNKPVTGTGTVKFYQVSYKADGTPKEKEILSQNVNPDENGFATASLNLKKSGQYRIEYTLDNGENCVCKGGRLVTVRGKDFNSKDCRFPNLEIIPDKDVYKPGDTLRLTINVDQSDADVWIFPRAVNDICSPPEKVKMNGKTGYYDLKIEMSDMPNFFVDAVTVANNKVFSETCLICIPPARKILAMDVIPSKENYKPGENATVKIVLKDQQGAPFVGQAAVTIYDKSLECVSDNSNVDDISSVFWGWKRIHIFKPIESSLRTDPQTLYPKNSVGMAPQRIFEPFSAFLLESPMLPPYLPEIDRSQPAPSFDSLFSQAFEDSEDPAPNAKDDGTVAQKPISATGRTNVADTAYWTGAIVTNEKGEAVISFKMPKKLTTWKIKASAMGKQTEVGHAEAEITTKKK